MAQIVLDNVDEVTFEALKKEAMIRGMSHITLLEEFIASLAEAHMEDTRELLYQERFKDMTDAERQTAIRVLSGTPGEGN